MKHIQAFLASTTPHNAHLYLAARQQLIDIGYVAILHLTEIMLHGNEQAAWKAIRLLAALSDKRLIPAYLQALNSPYSLIRQASANVLGEMGDPGVVPALLDHLIGDSAMVQVAIIQALGDLKDLRAVDPLLGLLAQTPSTEVQHCIIKVLGYLGDSRAASVLPAFFESPDRHVRSRAREVYQQLTSPHEEEH